MAKRVVFPGREAAIEYLHSRGYTIPDTVKDAYLKRQYSTFVRNPGVEAKDLIATGRGHTSVQFHPATKYTPGQYSVGSQAKPPTTDDARKLLNKANPVIVRTTSTTGNKVRIRKNMGPMRGSISGMVEYRAKNSNQVVLEYRTLSFSTDAQSYEAALVAHAGNIVEFARSISGYDWKEVFSINLMKY